MLRYDVAGNQRQPKAALDATMPSTHTYAGGCLVHARMWQELNWRKLAEVLAK